MKAFSPNDIKMLENSLVDLYKIQINIPKKHLSKIETKLYAIKSV